MRIPTLLSTTTRTWQLADLPMPVSMERLSPTAQEAPWEVEIGFGKGKYLLKEAAAHRDRRYLGIEIVSKYYRLVHRRAVTRGLDNLVLIRGEALYLLSTTLPTSFASRLHVYFPDPWPKSRHHRRRLFDPETADLVLGLLRPGGELCFATDFLEYGEKVRDILAGFPGLSLGTLDQPWPEGARTNYEAKFIREGRPILRLVARRELQEDTEELHPEGRCQLTAAVAKPADESVT